MFKNKIPVPMGTGHKQVANPVVHTDPIRRIGDQLINWFLREDPPASYVNIIPGSLKPIGDSKTNWIAQVMTQVYLTELGAKQHISNVFFRVDGRNKIINQSVTFPS